MPSKPTDQLRQALAALTGLPLASAEIAVMAQGFEKAARRVGYILVDTGYGSVTMQFANKKLSKVDMNLTEV